MDTLTNLLQRTFCALVVAGIALSTRPAAAAVFDLRAASTTVVMADGTPVEMWGFGLTSDPDVSIPGPVLEIPPGDGTLTIHLENDLPVPVSIVIPGIPAPLTPVWDDGTSGPRTSLTQRAVSFTHVVPPGLTGDYQWTNVQPGTYLYHSGTHPAVQVAMGLHGAVRHDATAGGVYGVDYDVDALLVYSEVDPDLNAAVTNGTYGTAAYPTTVDYRPRYFLINGEPAGSAPPLAAEVNQRLLLRLVNAGQTSIVPTLTDGTMRLLAEDGQPAPFAREAYSMLLPAGKTHDALLVLTEPASPVLFDRRGGARLARWSVTMPAGAPLAANDGYSVDEDSPLVIAAPGVLGNDTGVGLTAVLGSTTAGGTLALAADGSFAYTPGASFDGVDTFTYQATDGTLSSNLATVAITVNPINDAPVAADDAYVATAGIPLVIGAPGVLGNDTDVDMEMLSSALVSGPGGGMLTLNVDGSFQYTPGPGTTTDSFTYQAVDGSGEFDLATVTITVVPHVNAPPVAVDDDATTTRNTPVVINVVGNDSDPDGTIVVGTVVVVSPTTRGGTAESLGDGTVRYTPRRNFRGTDTFTYTVEDNEGAVSESATVRVNVTQ